MVKHSEFIPFTFFSFLHTVSLGGGSPRVIVILNKRRCSPRGGSASSSLVSQCVREGASECVFSTLLIDTLKHGADGGNNRWHSLPTRQNKKGNLYRAAAAHKNKYKKIYK